MNVQNPQFSPPLSEKVVETVAEQVGVDELELPHLANVIDPDALDALFTSPPASNRSSPASVDFEYADQRVTVFADGTIAVE